MTTLKHWIAPTIVRHGGAGLNKFGGVRQSLYLDAIDGVPVSQLIERFGSPLFVMSEARLRETARRMRRAFTSRYPKVRFGWSYKTNYLNAVCGILHQEGFEAEVVSGFEYEKARTLGVPGNRIIFNGPLKTREDLQRAVSERAQIHIDHLDELYLLEAVVRDAGLRDFPVAIRLNFDTGYSEPWSRFGFNLETGQAMDAARRIANSPWLQLVGLHNHIGTYITDPRAYSAQVRIMAGFVTAVEAATGCTIRFLDTGGGFASRNSLQGVYLPPEQVVPSIEQYADAICNTLHECFRDREAQGKPLPELILESGRAVVDESAWLLSSVVANKRLADGRRGLVVDAGVNVLFTAFWYNHDVRLTKPAEGLPEETVIYGPMCMNIDVLRQSLKLPPLSPGEVLAFWPVGAYNNTQWMQFIAYRPAVVMVRENGSVDILRRREKLQDITDLESLPDGLQPNFQD